MMTTTTTVTGTDSAPWFLSSERRPAGLYLTLLQQLRRKMDTFWL